MLNCSSIDFCKKYNKILLTQTFEQKCTLALNVEKNQQQNVRRTCIFLAFIKWILQLLNVKLLSETNSFYVLAPFCKLIYICAPYNLAEAVKLVLRPTLGAVCVSILGSYCMREGNGSQGGRCAHAYQYHAQIYLDRSESQGSVCMFIHTNFRILSGIFSSFPWQEIGFESHPDWTTNTTVTADRWEDKLRVTLDIVCDI